jgi:chromosome segregation ATPase
LCQVAKAAREQVGVELYGFQQHLAKLQLTLERSSERCVEVGQKREEADAQLRQLRRQVAEEEALTTEQQARVDKLQQELDRLAETLRQIERYNEQMASEIAVTKRAASATEGQVQQLEGQKQEQDFLIDSLQQQLARLARQLELHSAQLDAQRVETRAAQEFLAKAVSDMEGVQFEKRQLVSQWRSSLLSMQRRDEALEVSAGLGAASWDWLWAWGFAMQTLGG